MSVSPQAPTDPQAFAAASEPWFRESLRRLVEHPSVSPGGERVAEQRAVAAEAQALIEAGGGRAELIETAGTPVVLGHFDHPEPRARVLVYNHLDVQPADPESWSRGDPFKLLVEEDRERGFLYRGRGATDDKGPALCALRAATHTASRELPITVTLVWETEEEIGSPHFREAVSSRRERLRCDAAIVSDTIWPSADQPAISTGLRGGLQGILRLRTAAKQTHSGLAGGVARNPVRELCALTAAIHAAGFWHQGVTAPSPDEVASFLASGFDTDYFKRAHGVELLETEVPLEMMLRLWTRPTFEVHGLTGGYMGPGLMTVVPDQAELKFSFRLVPDQDPDQIAALLESFVSTFNPDVEVMTLGRLRPFRAPVDGPAHEAITRALAESFGRPPVVVREGGSIGAVPILAGELGVPVHFLPLSLPEHGYHAPDEFFDWRQARGGIEAFARVFAHLAGV